MSADLAAARHRASPDPGSQAARLPYPVLLVTAALAALFTLFHASYWSMILLWWHSQTFAHGFIIVPISVWLIWKQRARLATLSPTPCWWGLLLLAGLGVLWLLATLANVQVLRQYAVTLMIPATVITVLGWRVAGAIAFPLAYLLLAVPFGEFLVPPLINFTADFTVAALQLTGIPVFHENNSLVLPSGNWAVVDACSGLRYVIASIALGTLYAYLSYRSLTRRLAFMAVAVCLPVLANGLRAYMIVMIGHWSEMRLATGIDHLIYGWVFFGLVSLLLFWCGSFWSDRPPEAKATPRLEANPAVAPVPRRGLAAAALAVVAVTAGWPALAALALQPQAAPPQAQRSLLIAAAPPSWQPVPQTDYHWRALHAGHPLSIIRNYQQDGALLLLQISYYPQQNKDAELLAPVIGPVSRALSDWRESEAQLNTVLINQQRLTVRETIVHSGASKMLVWRWYRQSGVDTARPQVVKLLLAKNKLLRQREDGAEILVAAQFDESSASATRRLQALLSAMLPAIDQGLNDVYRH